MLTDSKKSNSHGGTGTIISRTSMTDASATQIGVVCARRWRTVCLPGVVCAAITCSPYAMIFRFNLKTNAMTCATAAYRFGGMA